MEKSSISIVNQLSEFRSKIFILVLNTAREISLSFHQLRNLHQQVWRKNSGCPCSVSLCFILWYYCTLMLHVAPVSH